MGLKDFFDFGPHWDLENFIFEMDLENYRLLPLLGL